MGTDDIAKLNGTGSAFPYEVPVGELEKKNGYNVLSMNITETDHPSRPGVPQSDGDNSNHVLVYVLIPLGALILIAALSFLVIFILKKSKLDRLRHHLMPLYNFDPMEEGGDWESELLEEDKEQQVALHIGAVSPDGPKLKFHTEQYEI